MADPEFFFALSIFAAAVTAEIYWAWKLIVMPESDVD
jgi:hypothetical protein